MKPLALLVFALILVSAAPASAQIHERIYPAPTAALDPSRLPAGAAIGSVKTKDGLTLKGVEIAPREGKPTLLVFHGNGSSATGPIRWLAPLIAEGYGVVSAEYREYSGNPGKASEAGLAADADAFYARARTVAGNGKLIVVGHSLGGGVAFGLARRHKLDALVTIDTFTDLRAMAPPAARWLISDRYDNAAAIVTLDEPCYLIHGAADTMIPPTHAETLFKAASAARRTGALFTIRGSGHSPDIPTLAVILRAVAAKTQGGDMGEIKLPATVTLTPFGS
jgi:fermentation-respiration switch protein FrsA (DUF1100 family)